MKYLLPLLLCSTAFATPGDWRITWWNPSNSMQQPIIARADPLKPAVMIGVTPDNIPVQANLGAGLVHDATAKLLNVDFTGYATTASLSGYVATTDFTWSNLGGKPNLFSGSYADLTGKPTLFDGQYSSLTGVPSTFTPSSHTHAWSDIVSGKPTTLSGYGITDGVTASGLSGTLSGYATTTALTSGLAGKLDSSSFTWSGLAGKPTFAAVATSGSYNDLTGKPTIPAAQVNSDWNSVSGVSQILNKPTIPTNNNQLTNGSNFITQSGARTAISLTTTGSGAATYNSSTGALNIPTPATAKRQETYSGTTNASGQYTVTFGTAYAVAPNIQAGLINGADNQNLRVTAISTTGFTVLARNRVDVVGLLPTWTNVSGIGVDVLITEK